MGIFNSKHFNSEVFGRYLETVPRVKQNAFIKAGILRSRADLKTMLTEQTGGNFISVPMTGLIGGDALNYDGNTDITATGLETFLQSMIVVGRAKAWEEKDFTKDITGKDFMEDIAAQVANYWDDVDQATILATLKGIFGVTANGFNTKHTLDITGGGDASRVGATTLNTAIQQAAGDNKNLFTMAIMHSVVATNLENLQVLEYYKQTDANGVQKSTGMATWNGRTVLIDDDVPTEDVPESSDGAKDGYTKYTTYILGQNAFDYCDCGVAVPNEPHRDPKSAGGKEWLITRQRKIFAPKGFSFVQPSAAIISPTNEQLETAARWTVVKDSAGTGYFDTKAIPFARIISRG
jgi:hypothetical protein